MSKLQRYKIYSHDMKETDYIKADEAEALEKRNKELEEENFSLKSSCHSFELQIKELEEQLKSETRISKGLKEQLAEAEKVIIEIRRQNQRELMNDSGSNFYESLITDYFNNKDKP